MNFRTMIKMLMNVVLVILGISVVMGQSVMAQTRLGLHFTQEELNIWRQRAISGPYKSASGNTPGDWDRIVANKNGFMSNPSAEIWDGYTGSGCVPQTTSISPLNHAIRLRDAAFFALIKEDSTVANQVRQTLLAQVARPGTDFSNTSKWCVTSSTRLGSQQPAFPAGEWAVRVLYAYDYVKGYLSSSDRNTIETWFLRAGTYFRLNSMGFVEVNYGNETNFVNGTLAGQGITNSTTCGTSSSGYTHRNGNPICWLGDWHNNRFAHMISFVGQTGVLLNNTTMKNFGAAWVKSLVKYWIYPDTTLAEMQRGWQDSNAAAGWYYPFQTWGKAMDIADTFARAGDLSLYQYSTSIGAGPTAGGPKSLKHGATFFVATSEGTALYYKWGGQTVLEHLQDALWLPGGGYYTYDVWLAQYNLYWKDPAITAAYLDPGPKNKHGQTSNREPVFGATGAGKAYPGKLFMWGQMEGKVWPYGASKSDPVVAPANLRVISSGQ